MKRSLKLATAAVVALSATSAMATNGTNLVGYGAKSRAMGGTGVAQYQGAESVFNNPALIGYSEEDEVTIGGTILAPDVSYTMGAQEQTSDASASIIPAVGMVHKISDEYSIGLAMYGVGGMGIDYANNPFNPGERMSDNLMTMRLSVPMAYTTNGFSVGIAPIIEYGALAMSKGTVGQDGGVTSDIAFGYEVGLAYTNSGYTIGADYKSAIEHDYKGTFNSNTTGGTQSLLDSPAVATVGASYNYNESTVSIEYKNIAYGSANGFQDFGWEDQNVYAIGYEYARDNWAARAGLNYGAQPIDTNAPSAIGSLMAFPGVTEMHYTAGGSYAFNDKMSLDVAFVYGKGSASTENFGPLNIEAVNDQFSATAGLNIAF